LNPSKSKPSAAITLSQLEMESGQYQCYVGAFKKSLYSGMCTILALIIRTVKNNGHSALI